MTSPWAIGRDIAEVRRLRQALRRVFEDPATWQPLDRFDAAVQYSEGDNPAQIARSLGRAFSTVRRWLEGFERAGLRACSGSPPGRTNRSDISRS